MLKTAAVAVVTGLALLASAVPATADHGGPTVCPLTTVPAGWDPAVTSYTVPADPSGVLGDDVCGLDDVHAVDLGGDGVDELLMSTFHLDWLLVVRADGVGTWRQMGAQVGDWDSVDFNGDGLIDLWWDGEEGEGFLTYLNTTSSDLVDGLIRFPAWISGDTYRWAIVALADFDRDGAMDVVGAEQDTAELVVRFGADGRRLVLGPLDREADSYHLTVTDANRDPFPDVQVQREGVVEAPVVYLSNGRGRFRVASASASRPGHPAPGRSGAAPGRAGAARP